MKRIVLVLALILVMVCPSAALAAGSSSLVKDLTRPRGMCRNPLVGYGLVVGLSGTGDTRSFADKTLYNMLDNLGIKFPISEYKLRNMAAVMLTAELPAFARSGDTISVSASSLGDAGSLEGGTLLLSVLKGADGKVYVTAQGAVSLGGGNLNAGGAGKSGGRNFPTVGIIPEGGLVCSSVSSPLVREGFVSLSLNRESFADASAIAKVINKEIGSGIAVPEDPGTVKIQVPYGYINRPVEFISRIGKLPVVSETSNRVVINERTGTLVIGGDVRIKPVAISHRGLQIAISHPGENAAGSKEKESGPGSVVALPAMSTVSQLVETLNLMGVGTRDLIAIFQTIKKAGAMDAELILQ